MPQNRPDLPVGETVDVKLRSGLVIANAPLVIRMGNGTSVEDVTVPAGTSGEDEIDVVSPLNWPPLAGDVWTDGQGKPWFCKKDPIAAEPDRLRMYVYDNSEGPMGIQSWKTAKRPVTRVFRATTPA